MAVGLGIDNGPKLRPKTTMDTDWRQKGMTGKGE
jgi:hypothetical protein